MSVGGRNFFVDSNVLLYQLSYDDPPKQRAAEIWMLALWESRSGRISWQVIHEFYSNASGKLRIPVTVARRFADRMLEWEPSAPSAQILNAAWHWCDRAQVNYWDSLILAAAQHADCRWLLSEDFTDGSEFGGVTVINPFLHDPKEFGLV